MIEDRIAKNPDIVPVNSRAAAIDVAHKHSKQCKASGPGEPVVYQASGPGTLRLPMLHSPGCSRLAMDIERALRRVERLGASASNNGLGGPTS